MSPLPANEGPFNDAVDKYMESGGAPAGLFDAMMAQGLGTCNLNPDGVVANQDASFQGVSFNTAYLLPNGSVDANHLRRVSMKR